MYVGFSVIMGRYVIDLATPIESDVEVKRAERFFNILFDAGKIPTK